jgi:hypothetical protein
VSEGVTRLAEYLPVYCVYFIATEDRENTTTNTATADAGFPSPGVAYQHLQHV